MFRITLLLLALFSITSLSADPQYSHGGIDRGDITKKNVSFVFTGGYHGEGVDHILDTLKEKKVKGGFFLTGNYLRNSKFRPGVERMVREGHYVGAHSDNHPKYVKYHGSSQTLVSKKLFWSDLDKNFAALATYGIKKSDATLYIPPYETYNSTIAKWCNEYGLTIFKHTNGTSTNGDYTDPSMKYYYSSKTILNKVWAVHAQPNGLNGHIMLVHVGVGPKRTDKLYYYLGGLIDELRKKGYNVLGIDELIAESKK